MAEFFRLVRTEWQITVPWMFILLVAMILDVIMGLLIAVSSQQLSSSVSWKGISRKVGVLVLIAFSCALDPMVPLQLSLIVTIGYIVPEGISILENGAKLGITKNQALIDVLERLRSDPSRLRDQKTIKRKDSDQEDKK